MNLQNLILKTFSPVQALEAARFLGNVKSRLEELFDASSFWDWDGGMEGNVEDLSAVCCYCCHRGDCDLDASCDFVFAVETRCGRDKVLVDECNPC